MPSFFSYETDEDYPYLLLCIYDKGEYKTASYNKGTDGEYITSIITGERFYSLYDYIISIKGMNYFDEMYSVIFFDEDRKDWFPVKFLLKD